MTIIEEKYIKTHAKSADLAESAELIFPDGVTHNGRKFKPFPIYMDKAVGSLKWDIDGNQYYLKWIQSELDDSKLLSGIPYYTGEKETRKFFNSVVLISTDSVSKYKYSLGE